ncbi:MAG: MoaD/ThiS family protein [Pirellulales bacterium]|nr:MoaD/ThiS family protein [Pirellulales bacterium]
MRIDVLITGRSYHLASAVPPALELPEGSSLRDALARLDALVPREAQFSPSCLLAIGGRHVGTLGAYDDVILRDGDELVILAPVSGG